MFKARGRGALVYHHMKSAESSPDDSKVDARTRPSGDTSIKPRPDRHIQSAISRVQAQQHSTLFRNALKNANATIVEEDDEGDEDVESPPCQDNGRLLAAVDHQEQLQGNLTARQFSGSIGGVGASATISEPPTPSVLNPKASPNASRMVIDPFLNAVYEANKMMSEMHKDISNFQNWDDVRWYFFGFFFKFLTKNKLHANRFTASRTSSTSLSRIST